MFLGTNLFGMYGYFGEITMVKDGEKRKIPIREGLRKSAFSPRLPKRKVVVFSTIFIYLKIGVNCIEDHP